MSFFCASLRFKFCTKRLFHQGPSQKDPGVRVPPCASASPSLRALDATVPATRPMATSTAAYCASAVRSMGAANSSGAFALVAAQAFGKTALVSLAMISLIILAAGAVPVRRPSRLVETAALVSFSMFISNEVVRIAWFGVVNAANARFALSEPAQWVLWGCGVLAAVAFAFAFHFAVDDRIQSRVRAWLKRRSARRGKAQPKLGPVISIDG
mgnify:CR=1 FL=1